MKSEATNADHALSFHAPDFQVQAADDVEGMKRRGFGFLQFGNSTVCFREAIKRNAMVQVVDMMIADVAGEPRHDGIGL